MIDSTTMTRKKSLKKTPSNKEALLRFDELVKRLESDLRQQESKRQYQGLTSASFRLVMASYILTDAAKDLAVVQDRTQILDSIQTIAEDIITLKKYIDRLKEDVRGDIYEQRTQKR